MGSWSFTPIILRLSDPAFNELKKQFAKTYKHIAACRKDALTNKLMGILCSPEHFDILDRTEFAHIIDLMFSDFMKNNNWIYRYMNELVTYLPVDNNKRHLGYDGRAELYYKHVSNTLPTQMKSLLKTLDDDTISEAMDILFDQVRFTLAIHTTWKHESKDTVLIDNVRTRIDGSETVESFFELNKENDQSTMVLGVKIPIIDPKTIIPVHAMHNDEQQLCILLTRALLCELQSPLSEDEEDE